jgi:hypothetical protein
MGSFLDPDYIRSMNLGANWNFCEGQGIPWLGIRAWGTSPRCIGTERARTQLLFNFSISVKWNQRDALSMQFVVNKRPLHVSSITCSSSGGAKQTAFGILRAYYGYGTVAASLNACHRQLTLYARSIPNAVWVAPPEDEQIMLEACRGAWFSINCMKSASRWFH